MKKKTSLLFIVILFSMSLISQTVNKKIVDQMNDPKTAENAAKADVYISKKLTMDTLTQNVSKPALPTKKHKNKYCKKPKRDYKAAGL